jgi:hypothetical protein
VDIRAEDNFQASTTTAWTLGIAPSALPQLVVHQLSISVSRSARGAPLDLTFQGKLELFRAPCKLSIHRRLRDTAASGGESKLTKQQRTAGTRLDVRVELTGLDLRELLTHFRFPIRPSVQLTADLLVCLDCPSGSASTRSAFRFALQQTNSTPLHEFLCCGQKTIDAILEFVFNSLLGAQLTGAHFIVAYGLALRLPARAPEGQDAVEHRSEPLLEDAQLSFQLAGALQVELFKGLGIHFLKAETDVFKLTLQQGRDVEFTLPDIHLIPEKDKFDSGNLLDPSVTNVIRIYNLGPDATVLPADLLSGGPPSIKVKLGLTAGFHVQLFEVFLPPQLLLSVALVVDSVAKPVVRLEAGIDPAGKPWEPFAPFKKLLGSKLYDTLVPPVLVPELFVGCGLNPSNPLPVEARATIRLGGCTLRFAVSLSETRQYVGFWIDRLRLGDLLLLTPLPFLRSVAHWLDPILGFDEVSLTVNTGPRVCIPKRKLLNAVAAKELADPGTHHWEENGDESWAPRESEEMQWIERGIQARMKRGYLLRYGDTALFTGEDIVIGIRDGELIIQGNLAFNLADVLQITVMADVKLSDEVTQIKAAAKLRIAGCEVSSGEVSISDDSLRGSAHLDIGVLVIDARLSFCSGREDGRSEKVIALDLETRKLQDAFSRIGGFWGEMLRALGSVVDALIPIRELHAGVDFSQPDVWLGMRLSILGLDFPPFTISLDFSWLKKFMNQVLDFLILALRQLLKNTPLYAVLAIGQCLLEMVGPLLKAMENIPLLGDAIKLARKLFTTLLGWLPQAFKSSLDGGSGSGSGKGDKPSEEGGKETGEGDEKKENDTKGEKEQQQPPQPDKSKPGPNSAGDDVLESRPEQRMPAEMEAKLTADFDAKSAQLREVLEAIKNCREQHEKDATKACQCGGELQAAMSRNIDPALLEKFQPDILDCLWGAPPGKQPPPPPEAPELPPPPVVPAADIAPPIPASLPDAGEADLVVGEPSQEPVILRLTSLSCRLPTLLPRGGLPFSPLQLQSSSRVELHSGALLTSDCGSLTALYEPQQLPQQAAQLHGASHRAQVHMRVERDADRQLYNDIVKQGHSIEELVPSPLVFCPTGEPVPLLFLNQGDNTVSLTVSCTCSSPQTQLVEAVVCPYTAPSTYQHTIHVLLPPHYLGFGVRPQSQQRTKAEAQTARKPRGSRDGGRRRTKRRSSHSPPASRKTCRCPALHHVQRTRSKRTARTPTPSKSGRRRKSQSPSQRRPLPPSLPLLPPAVARRARSIGHGMCGRSHLRLLQCEARELRSPRSWTRRCPNPTAASSRTAPPRCRRRA